MRTRTGMADPAGIINIFLYAIRYRVVICRTNEPIRFGLGAMRITNQKPESSCLLTDRCHSGVVGPGVIILVLLVKFIFIARSHADCLSLPFF